jgi:hypothetical protein
MGEYGGLHGGLAMPNYAREEPGEVPMSPFPKDDLMERIERLELANKRWRLFALLAGTALVVVLVVAGFAFSQREQPKEPQPQAPAAGQFPTDSSGLSTVYTNFCRVSVTPEELMLDFGLNTQVPPDPKEPIKLSQRVVMNFYTAKRLLNALHGVVQNHEATYGVLELDFQKRALPGAKLPGGGK